MRTADSLARERYTEWEQLEYLIPKATLSRPEIEQLGLLVAGVGVVGQRVELDELLRQSDVVSLHTPLTPETHHLIDAERILRMKQGSLLINTSRGALVDTAALISGLKDGHLGGAGLDVYEHEPRVHPRLVGLENVVLLPHIGSATWETRVRMADCCFADLITMLADGRVPARALVGAVG